MDLRNGIIETARAIGANPHDLATVISYETGGTFDPVQAGPTTQWGQHRGLIQFGEPQAQQHGVDWDDPLGSQLGPNGAVANYLKSSGFKPGMGLLDLYSTVNAGAPGRYNASDANNGGAPGNVRDKVTSQMEGHRRKAAELLGTVSTQGQTETPMQQQEKPRGLLGQMFPNAKEGGLDQVALGLMSMSSNPTPGMVAQMRGIQGRMADQRDEKKASAQANKTIEALRNAGVPDQDLQIAMNNPAYMRELLGQVAKSRMGQAEAGYKQVRGSDIGMTGENAERMYNLGPDGKITGIGGGGTTTNINMGGDAGEYLYGTDGGVPAGWRVHRQTGEASRIPGGPAAAEAAANEQQAQGRQEQTERAGSTVVQDLQRGLDLIPELGMLSQGEGVVGGISRTTAAGVPGTVANRITQFTESALSNVGLDTLQQMRENSPTGGALGQVPIQQQKRLEQVLGSLDISQPPPVLQANIKRVMNIYTDIMHGTAEERRNAVQNGKLTPEDNQRINSYYYDLPFDERGRAQDDADGVPVYNVETGRWE